MTETELNQHNEHMAALRAEFARHWSPRRRKLARFVAEHRLPVHEMRAWKKWLEKQKHDPAHH